MTKHIYWLIIFAFCALFSACSTGTPSGRPLPNCPTTHFAKQALVFEVVAICATHDVPDDTFQHAANVAAEWLDNDTDGIADEARVIESLKSSKPFLIMTKDGPGFWMMRALSSEFKTRVGQDLSAEETNPPAGRRDASQEEIHHLILTAGWKLAYPEIFSDTPGSAIYRQWEQAERQGFYNYNDFTCDAHCKTVEFFYLATAAYLGSDADLQSDEMRLKTRKQLTSKLPDTVAIIESDNYTYPTDHWPTGTYPHQDKIKLIK